MLYTRNFVQLLNYGCSVGQLQRRMANTIPDFVIERHRKSRLSNWQEPATTQPEPLDTSLDRSRDLYPEFLPNVIWYRRDKIKEKLERVDMMKRRANIQVPEFYVGSIMKVTSSHPHAQGKQTVFVGICIQRQGFGLQHSFTLRNVVDGMGVEIMYHLYNPTIQKVEVLKLERRLDTDLSYLRDAPPEFSTIPFDMEPIALPKGSAVPINSVKIKLNSPPWFRRWELLDLKGAIVPQLSEPREKRAQIFKKQRDMERWDLMKHYRETVKDDEATTILKEVRSSDRKISHKPTGATSGTEKK